MNYLRNYNNLISRAKKSSIDGYTENHHVIPKCMGGDDSSSNIVSLTPREHFVAHILLTKIYPENRNLIFAVKMMCVAGNGHDRRINNRMYGWLRLKFSETVSIAQTGEGNPHFGKIWIYSTEQKKSIRIYKSELQNYIDLGWHIGRKIKFDGITCEYCGQRFLPKKHEKFCSKECKCNSSVTSNNERLIIEISKKYTIFNNSIKKNRDFILECYMNSISTNKILLYIGCNNSGPNYKTIDSICASVCPLATNQLKG